MLILLSVLIPGLPEVTIYASQLKTREGGNLTFECQVTGSPTPKVMWQTEELASNSTVQVGRIFRTLSVFMQNTASFVEFSFGVKY